MIFRAFNQRSQVRLYNKKHDMRVSVMGVDRLVVVVWMCLVGCQQAPESDSKEAQMGVLTFRTFDEFRTVASDESVNNYSKYLPRGSLAFRSLYSLYEEAMELERNALKADSFDEASLARLRTSIEAISPRIGLSREKGPYIKVFNPVYAKVLNKDGAVFIGGDLFLFEDESYIRIDRNDLSGYDLSNATVVLSGAPHSTYPIRQSKSNISALSTQRSDCTTLKMPQLPSCSLGDFGYCIGAQRVEGCVNIIRYSTPIYETHQICNYGGGPTDPDVIDGVPVCQDYSIYVGDRTDSYDAVVSYSGRKNFYFIFDWGSSSYKLTSMMLQVYVNGNPVYNSTVTDSSNIAWSQSGYLAGAVGGFVRADVSIQDQNTFIFFNPPVAPQIINLSNFF